MSLMSKFNAPVASNNDGRRLFSKAPSKAYSDGWDAVFGKKECRACMPHIGKRVDVRESCAQCGRALGGDR